MSCSLTLALASSALAAPPPPPAVPVLIFGDGVGGCYFYEDPFKIELNGSIRFTNQDTVQHDAVQREGFWIDHDPGGR